MFGGKDLSRVDFSAVEVYLQEMFLSQREAMAGLGEGLQIQGMRGLGKGKPHLNLSFD